MPTLSLEQAMKIVKSNEIHVSLSRIRIAQIVDEIFMRTLMLFDLNSISFFDRWILGYARIKIFQKMQTLFQMGKKKQLLELLNFIEKVLPELKSLAQSKDVFVTLKGDFLNEEEVEKEWNKEIPDEIKKFINEQEIWLKVKEQLEKDWEKRKGLNKE
jgi:hypothetical protein